MADRNLENDSWKKENSDFQMRKPAFKVKFDVFFFERRIAGLVMPAILSWERAERLAPRLPFPIPCLPPIDLLTKNIKNLESTCKTASKSDFEAFFHQNFQFLDFFKFKKCTLAIADLAGLATLTVAELCASNFTRPAKL